MYIVIFIFVGNLAVALVFITHLLWCIMRRGLDEEGINVVKQKLNEQNGAATGNLTDQYRQDSPQKTTTGSTTENLTDRYKEKAPQIREPLQTEKASVLFCSQCGAKLKSKDQKFCENCGFHIEPSKETSQKVFCTQCGTENKSEAAFCKNCGTPLGKSKAAETQNAVQ